MAFWAKALPTINWWQFYHLLALLSRIVASFETSDACVPCQTVACSHTRGLYQKSDLPLGYNLVVRIPEAVCNITIIERVPSSNFLALRAGTTYIINGNWGVAPPGRYMGAGTGFLYSYISPGNKERIFAPGPALVNVDVMVIYQSGSVDIQYEYWQPIRSQRATAKQGRKQYKRRFQTDEKFHGEVPLLGPNINPATTPYINAGGGVLNTFGSWQVWKFTPCSKPCGGGEQGAIYICTSSSGQILNETFCFDERPTSEVIACNSKPCPPKWVFGDWSPCSVTCGVGYRTRTRQCLQEISPEIIRVAPSAMCVSLNDHPGELIATTMHCTMDDCTRWHVEPWEKCSVGCGTGIQTRRVTCKSGDLEVREGDCNPEERPRDQMLCHALTCARNTWFFTEWSTECIGGCVNGVHVRRVWCSPGRTAIGAICTHTSKPPVTKPCSNSIACAAAWFNGPWSVCSVECGNGTQSREVVCVRYLQGSFRATIDGECDSNIRPQEHRACNVEPCPPYWYFTDWTQCSRECGGGSQWRAIQCLDEGQQPSLKCQIEDRPKGTRPCNAHSCVIQIGSRCKDEFHNCPLVQRARLCRHSYYRSICCASCSIDLQRESLYGPN